MMKKTLSVALFAGLLAFQSPIVYADELLLESTTETNEIGLETVPAVSEDAVEGNAEEKQELAAEPEDQKKIIGIVTLQSGNLNVRKGPSLEDEIIGKLPNGSTVEVLEELEEWVGIPHNGSIAYVSKPYLQLKTAQAVPKPIKTSGKRVIVLDPGHGGKDVGANPKKGVYESDITWRYTVKAKEVLEKAGYIVYLTRGEKTSCVDVYKSSQEDLACRSAFASKVDGDLFISIHADANPNKKFRGTVTFYNARDDYDGAMNPYPLESQKLAELVHAQVQPAMGSTDRGVQNKSYYVNRNNTVPSVLIELAVLTNSTDYNLIQDKNKPAKFASALKKAIDQYFKTNSHE